MKRLFSVVVLCFSLLGFGFSEGLDFDQLIHQLTDSPMKALTKDIGSVLAGNMFHSGKNIGTFAIGIPRFEIGVAVAGALKPNKGNIILNQGSGAAGTKKDQMFGIPFVQVGLGLPFNLDVIVRGAPKYQNITLLGGAVKYCIFKKSFAVTSFGLSAMYSYNKLEYSTFKANVSSLAGIFSVKVPMVEPYIGFAIDNTKLETQFSPKQLQDAGVAATATLQAKTSEPRLVAGLTFSMIPFTYINVAGTKLNDHYGVDAGLGLKF